MEHRDPYTREVLRMSYASAFLFASSVLFGIAAFFFAQDSIAETLDSIVEFAQTFITLTPLQLFAAIVVNNAVKMFSVLLLGIAAGIAPVIFLIINGIVVGIVLAHSAVLDSVAVAAIGIIPHGMFEFSALFLSTGVGLMLGKWSIERMRGRATTTLLFELRRAGNFFILIVFPLLVVAAFIETFLTPILINFVR